MKINSKQNKSIKLAAKLHNKKERDKSGLFIIEGEKLVKEAINSGIEVETIFVIDNPDLENPFSSFSTVLLVDYDLMKYISTTETPPKFLAIAKKKLLDFDVKQTDFLLVLNDLQDSGNIGTIIRTAEATNFKNIALSNKTADLFNPKVLRSSMGSVFRCNFIYYEKLDLFLDSLSDISIFASSPRGKINLYSLDTKGKIAFVIGNEGQGVPESVLEKYNSINIPMANQIESLNTAIASSVILYEIYRKLNF